MPLGERSVVAPETSVIWPRPSAVRESVPITVNVVAAVVFCIVAPAQIDVRAAAAVAVGAIVGGVLGARVGRRLSPALLRWTVVCIGLVALYTLI